MQTRRRMMHTLRRLWQGIALVFCFSRAPSGWQHAGECRSRPCGSSACRRGCHSCGSSRLGASGNDGSVVGPWGVSSLSRAYSLCRTITHRGAFVTRKEASFPGDLRPRSSSCQATRVFRNKAAQNIQLLPSRLPRCGMAFSPQHRGSAPFPMTKEAGSFTTNPTP